MSSIPSGFDINVEIALQTYKGSYTSLYFHHMNISKFIYKFDHDNTKQFLESETKRLQKEQEKNTQHTRDLSSSCHVQGGALQVLKYTTDQLQDNLKKLSASKEMITLIQTISETTDTLAFLNNARAEQIQDDSPPIINNSFWKSFQSLNGYPQVVINYPAEDIELYGNQHTKINLIWLLQNVKLNGLANGCGKVVITVDVIEQAYVIMP